MPMPFPGSAAVGQPSSAGEALSMATAGLSWLARADVASLPTPVQADALRGLERLLSCHAAARARVLAGFSAQRGSKMTGRGRRGRG
jgi:hypothetical protein